VGKFSSSGVGKQRNEMPDLMSNFHCQGRALPVKALRPKEWCHRPLLFERSKSLVRNCAERGRIAQNYLRSNCVDLRMKRDHTDATQLQFARCCAC